MECGREYMRDTRVRTAQKVHEHKTGRKCEVPGCNGDLKDTIINFGENLNPNIFDLAQQNCDVADLCLSMGTSHRLGHVHSMPLAVAENGGNFVNVNLQKTPLDPYCSMVIHAKCDDVMKLLMQKLGYEVPVWQMKKRLEVSLIENGSKLKLTGVEYNGQPFHLFKKVNVSIPNKKLSFPTQQQTKQPYKFTLPAEAQRPAQAAIELQFFGHYSEKNIQFNVDLAELANGPVTYEMVFDSPSGNWEIIVMYDSDKNVMGVAEFTQKNAPAN